MSEPFRQPAGLATPFFTARRRARRRPVPRTSRADLFGGIIIACGHFTMAVHSLTSFYTGLALIVIGTG